MPEYMQDEYGGKYQLPGPFQTIEDMRTEVHRRGGFYFDSSAYFAARYHDMVCGAILIDSVRDTITDRPREYRLTVLQGRRGMAHVPDPVTGEVKFSTLRAARRAAQRVCEACGVAPWKVSDMRPSEWAELSPERQLLNRIAKNRAETVA